MPTCAHLHRYEYEKEANHLQSEPLRRLYVGVDLHKTQHVAVILDCWNKKLGEIEFANTTAAFPKLIAKVNNWTVKSSNH
jgi:hypothetical protein